MIVARFENPFLFDGNDSEVTTGPLFTGPWSLLELASKYAAARPQGEV
jgi:hypothetical protein